MQDSNPPRGPHFHYQQIQRREPQISANMAALNAALNEFLSQVTKAKSEDEPHKSMEAKRPGLS